MFKDNLELEVKRLFSIFEPSYIVGHFRGIYKQVVYSLNKKTTEPLTGNVYPAFKSINCDLTLEEQDAIPVIWHSSYRNYKKPAILTEFVEYLANENKE